MTIEEKFIQQFKDLPKGIKRATIIGGFIIPILIGAIVSIDDALPAVIFSMVIYWVLVFAGVWIYEGFKEDKISPNEFSSKVIQNETQQLTEKLVIAKFRELAKARNCAPTEKTSDHKIMEIYQQVGSAFRNVANIRGEDIPAKNLNAIIFKFIQVYELVGDTFFLENLKYEIEKYKEEGLRQDYLEQEISLV